MSTPIRAAILFAALVACLPAQAQYLLGLETNIELTKQDLTIIRHTRCTKRCTASRSALPRNGTIQNRRIPAGSHSSRNSRETASNAKPSTTD